MSLKLLATATLDVVPQLLWHSERTESFVAGDEKLAYALPVRDFATPAPLAPARPFDREFPCRLPLPEDLQREFVERPWHGFEFLSADEYDVAFDDERRRTGDLLRTLYYGPDYGLYVRHRPSGLILSLRSGTLELLRRTEAGFAGIDSTRTKGRQALCFAGHPSASRIAYGDNYGTFHTHDFSAEGFGKAKKVDGKERKASAVEFQGEGETLLIGGMGYLSLYRDAGKKWELQTEVNVAVRDFCWLPATRRVVVNQGLHGISIYAVGNAELEKVDSLSLDEPIDLVAVSLGGEFAAASLKSSRRIVLISTS